MGGTALAALPEGKAAWPTTAFLAGKIASSKTNKGHEGYYLSITGSKSQTFNVEVKTPVGII